MQLMVAATLVLLCTRPLEVPVFGKVLWLLTVPAIAIIGREVSTYRLLVCYGTRVIVARFDTMLVLKSEEQIFAHLFYIRRGAGVGGGEV